MYAASYNWVKQSLKLNAYLQNQQNRERITAPMLLFQAENDAWVSDEQQDAFIAGVRNTKIKKVRMNGARHELEAEKAQVVRDMVVAMLEFLAVDKEADKA